MYTNSQVALLAAVEFAKDDSYYHREHSLLSLSKSFKKHLDELDMAVEDD